MKYRVFLPLIVIVLLGSPLSSQAQRLFYALGYNVNYGNPLAYSVSTGVAGAPRTIQQDAYYGIGYSLVLSANLLPLGDEMSLGLAGDINAGINIFSTESNFVDAPIGFGLHLPIFAQFKYGNFSGATSEQDFGFGVGLGTNFNGFFGPYVSDLQEIPSLMSTPNFVLMPAARISFRWWSESNDLRELNITASMGGKQEIVNTVGEYSRSSIFLSYVKYLNY